MNGVILETKACLQIAQSVYNEYLKAMEPPLYIFMTFPEWIAKGLEQMGEESEGMCTCRIKVGGKCMNPNCNAHPTEAEDEPKLKPGESIYQANRLSAEQEDK